MLTLKEAVAEKRKNYLGSLYNSLGEAHRALSLLSTTVEDFPSDSYGMMMQVDQIEKTAIRLAHYATKIRELDNLRYTADGAKVSDYDAEQRSTGKVSGDSEKPGT